MSGDNGRRATEREERELRAALRRASLDAPRTDLWPRLEAEVVALAGSQARDRRRFVALRRVRALLAATLSLLLVAGLLGAAWQLFSARSGGTATRGDVPDLLLLLDYPPGGGLPAGSATIAQPFASIRQPVADGVLGLPVVAPDGRQIVFVVQERRGDLIRTSLVARADDPLKEQWAVEIGSQTEAEAIDHPLNFRVAIGGDRVYVVAFRWQAPEPVIVRGVDRADGQERERWAVETAGATIGNLALYTAPDNRQLHLFATLVEGERASRLREVHVRFRLPDGRQERATLAGAGGPSDFLYTQGSRITPDGRTLYRLAYDGRLHLFDLQGGTAPTILPPLFALAADEPPLPMGQTPSHDGRRLYVVAPTRGEVAIVDLLDRRVERVQPLGDPPGGAPGRKPGTRLWEALRGLFVADAAANNNFTAAPQLSPDGRTLYATGATGRGRGAKVGGVWAIDTTDWRVTAHWQPDALFSRLLLGGDGRYLYAQRGDTLVALDTRTGVEAFTGKDRVGVAYSLAELYRDRYGRSPAIDGQRLWDRER